MKKSATDLMQEILFAAVIDSVVALRAASKGLPNTLLRDLNAIHPNTTLADLPTEVRSAIEANVRAAFARLLREGYTVAPANAGPPRPQPHGPRPERRPPGDRRPPRGGRPPRGKPPPR